ncbi:unnamed protein product [Ectocarpus sp. CCAP 1310/34]|nr:unnamed protein product [Ectocarpus sp. CCAP 1310/34]
MPGGDAVIGLPSAETVLEYDMPDYSTPSASAVQEISDATITQAGGVTTLKFVRPLEPSGDGKQLLSVSDPAIWLYAWGGSNTFILHSMVGGFYLALDSCSIGSLTGGTKAEYVHGWLMVLGWTLCFPMGILFARFSRSFKGLGFPAHRVLQSLGSLLVIAGFVVSVIFTEDEGLEHFKETHQINGLILTVFIGLQVVAAVLRPSKPPAGAMVQDATGQTKQQPVSKVRRAWALLHRVLGYIAVVMAVFQCFGGLGLVYAEDAWQLLYILLVVVMVTAFVVLQALACCRAKRDTPSDNSGPQQGGAVVAPSTM